MTNKTTTKKSIESAINISGPDFFKNLWGEGWTYIKTVVNVVEEPVLILDKNLFVIAANKPFYKTFKVKEEETEGKLLFKLGNKDWNIPELKELLQKILPQKTFFKGFEVSHEFPLIGRKIMILNARQLHFSEDINLKQLSPIILLAIEDVTSIMTVAEKMTDYTNNLEDKLLERTEKLEICIKKLEKEINEIKKNFK